MIPQANRDSSLETRPKWDLSKHQLGPRRRLVHPPCKQPEHRGYGAELTSPGGAWWSYTRSDCRLSVRWDPYNSWNAMIEPSAAPRQLVTKPLCLFFLGFGVGGGMLTSLWTCSRHVCFVNFGVAWVIYIYIHTHTILHNENHIRYIYI